MRILRQMTRSMRLGMLVGGAVLVVPWTIARPTKLGEMAEAVVKQGLWTENLAVLVYLVAFALVYFRMTWLVAALIGGWAVFADYLAIHVDHVTAVEAIFGHAFQGLYALILVSELAAQFSGRARVAALIFGPLGLMWAEYLAFEVHANRWGRMEFPPLAITAFAAIAGLVLMGVASWKSNGQEATRLRAGGGLGLAYVACLLVSILVMTCISSTPLLGWSIPTATIKTVVLSSSLLLVLVGAASEWRRPFLLVCSSLIVVVAACWSFGFLHFHLVVAGVGTLTALLSLLGPVSFAVSDAPEGGRVGAGLGFCLAHAIVVLGSVLAVESLRGFMEPANGYAISWKATAIVAALALVATGLAFLVKERGDDDSSLPELA